MSEIYYFDDCEDEDESIDLFEEDVKRVALYIMDSSGDIEDIITDLDDIKKYIDKLYEKYPSAD
jgi:hypothetical protein